MSVLDVSTGAGYIAKIEYQSFVDGEGVRCSVYVSGCPFQCQGCYNKAAQHFRYGEAMTHTVMEEVLDACAPEYIAGLSILGGEPFCNLKVVAPLVQAFRARYGREKSLWIWTGYLFEYLWRANDQRTEIMKQTDVIVDGMFMQKLYQPNLPYKGSLNQRVIDVHQFIKTEMMSQSIYIE
ncbi:TPA: anaerobic ribonucleoside-triphosphate reductase activating protein [Staphylococcus pseudintermedius]|uniref:anaerobic ribonucleoside-triphosphate reductase activating protein n=1 Tax=Staphylococcus pseudintermedius TaxID=283734 RepID=UPI000C1B9D49|nr:anaerobic ribonucleoside-triphosphate reductase activating protein [Staphylococcus pseudintermedius]EGQ0294853.1 anaerobic ribonucleoside-triphosphate reductase activating protein [Staphylococcus pseudintermedius]EGQ0368736.1 anaerobic ribonucleoside-triphosphate reductase activating protein [Staphylococcus pseudintermedius]EGQ1668960.1 anaerobic ribonucleoside-triphosphate reductase activating protein [Staphylococcus pseudintermedius]EGQ1697739.1 anaerobic ribonucleoside-triphosphate reduct